MMQKIKVIADKFEEVKIYFKSNSYFDIGAINIITLYGLLEVFVF